QLVDSGADLFYFSMAEFDRIDHGFFFHFLGARFDHHNSIGCANDHDVQKAVAHLAVSRVDQKLTRNQAYANGSNGAVEWDVADGQSSRRAVNSSDIGVVLRVGGEHEGDDLSLALEPVGEQRSNGTIDLPAG